MVVQDKSARDIPLRLKVPGIYANAWVSTNAQSSGEYPAGRWRKIAAPVPSLGSLRAARLAKAAARRKGDMLLGLPR
jgi:hypothetical protein